MYGEHSCITFPPETLPREGTYKSQRVETLHLLGHQFHLCFPGEKTKTENQSIILSSGLQD